MTTAQAPVRDYKFTDARLIELCLEKIALAERDATELATVGITGTWVANFNTRVLAFGAMPTDTIELGEQKEATDQKEEEADELLDKLKELRSTAKRALGEKSSAYGKFGFTEMDHFTDGDLLKLALVVPALTTKHAVALATKGWEAADNTELATLLNDFVGGLQNQGLEVDSRDSATEARIKEGNEIYDLLSNELCEAGKGYWRTISEAKFNDYIIHDTPSGNGAAGQTIVAESVIPPGVILNFDTSQLNATVNSSVRVEIDGGEMNIYAAELMDELPGATFWHLTDPTNVLKTLPEFAVLIGSSDTKKKVTFQNPGLTPTHYKLTFYNV